MLLTVFFAAIVNGQITITVTGNTNTTPNLLPTYPSLAAAITDLNLVTAMSGPVVFNLDAGTSETSTSQLTITVAGDAANSITFQKSGAGANPILTRTDGGTNSTSQLGALGDGIIRIDGTDNIIFDGLDLSASSSGIEYGYYTHKPSGTNGCQGLTIRNCAVTMTKGTSAYVAGIYIGNGSTSISSATGVTVTANSGRNENITITGNTISNVHAGIVCRGSSATGFYDQNFVIGQSGAGNTIQNFGGGASASTYGIYFIYTNNVNADYNTIDNAGGGGSAHGSTLYGIFYSNVSGNITGNNNTITMNTSGTSAVQWIYNGNQVTSNTFNNNIFAGSITATSSSYLIYASSATPTVSVSGNMTSGTITKSGTSGTFYGFYNFGNPTGGTSTITNNNFSNISVTGTSSLTVIRQETSSTHTANVNGNTISNITTGTGTFTGIAFSYNSGSINNNTISGVNAGGIVSCIVAGNSSTTGTQNISNNLIYGNSTSGNTSTILGIQSNAYGAVSVSNVYKNKIYDLNGTGTGTFVYGISVTNGINTNIYNNLIGDLKVTIASNTADAIRGISITASNASSGINVYYNSIYLNATSSGTDFSTSGIYHTTSGTATTASLTLRNNIIFNNSVPNGTGVVSCYRRSSTTLTNYNNASNNNDFYAVGGNVLYDGTTTYNIAAFKTLVSPRESSSFSEDPEFQSTLGSSADFLKFKVSSPKQVESGGAGIGTPPFPAPYNDDYIGTIRQGSTGYAGTGSAPDMGAWELEGISADLTAPAISYTPLGSTLCLSNRTFTATITDASGVNVTPGTAPRVYFKKTVNSNTLGGTNDNTTDGWKYYESTTGSSPFSFTIDNSLIFGGVSPGDVIEYFVVAQDNAAIPNVGINNGTFGTTPASVALTAAAFPIGGTINNFTFIAGGLSGTVNVGPGETYTTLSAAGGLFSAINSSGLTGNLTANITGNISTEDGSVALNAINFDCGGPYTLTIKTTGTYTVSGSSSTAIIRLNGADNVTIDGSVGSTANTVCPPSAASRDLTISNTNASTSSAVIMLYTTTGGDPATNNTVKNCIVTGNSNTTTLAGIHVGGTTVASGAGANQNNNNSIINNEVSRAVIGIFTAGSTTIKSSGTVINQNLMNGTGANSLGRFGIMSLLEDNLTVSGNSVSGIVYTGTGDAGGICIGANGGFSTSSMSGGEVTNATITHNLIGTVQQTSTYSASGIAVLTGTTGTVLVANNMVSGANSNGTASDFATGIFVTGGTGSTINVYHNSVTMTGTFTGADEASYAFAILSASPTVNVRNNIFTSTGSTGANRNRAIGFGFALPAANVNSDYNDLYVSGTGSAIGQTTTLDNSGGVDHSTMTDWQTNSTKDANSKNVLPTFISPTDLHLVAVDATNFNNLESFGVATSVTNDIDCESRPNGTAPDIGADEYVGSMPACPAPPAASISGITATAATATWAGTGSFILEYGPTGYTPGTAGSAGVGGTLIDPAVSPQSLTGLTPATTYDVYVRRVCAGPTWSNNSPVATFTTLIINDEAPGAISLTVGAGCTGASYTNVGATAGTSEPFPSCSGTIAAPVWYSFVAPASGAVRISTDVGSGNTFTDSKLGLFAATDVNDYSTFTILSCDEDGGSVLSSGFMSVLYATGLTPGTTYYIAVDKYSTGTTNGTFCLAVDELSSSMLSTTNTCASTYQTPFGSNATYNAWVPLLDGSSRLVALVRNTAGGEVNDYTVGQNINTAAVRSAGGQYYLDRNYRIANATATNVDIQFFFLTSEMTALNAADPTVNISNLGATRQTETVVGCHNDYVQSNGTSTTLNQTLNGTSTDGLVQWIQVNTPGFSNFYLKGGSIPLPAVMLSFSGYKSGSVNKLNWTTASEQDNLGFEVQRSLDGINYQSIGFVNTQAMGGNSAVNLHYSFVDNNVAGNRQYYRLRQVDAGNRSRFSNVVLIKGDKPATLGIEGLFPNPANSTINVLIAAPAKDRVNLVITDVVGRTVAQQMVNVETGTNTIPVNIQQLANGTYMVRLVCNNQCEVPAGKFIKQ